MATRMDTMSKPWYLKGPNSKEWQQHREYLRELKEMMK